MPVNWPLFFFSFSQLTPGQNYGCEIACWAACSKPLEAWQANTSLRRQCEHAIFLQQIVAWKSVYITFLFASSLLPLDITSQETIILSRYLAEQNFDGLGPCEEHNLISNSLFFSNGCEGAVVIKCFEATVFLSVKGGQYEHLPSGLCVNQEHLLGETAVAICCINYSFKKEIYY